MLAQELVDQAHADSVADGSLHGTIEGVIGTIEGELKDKIVGLVKDEAKKLVDAQAASFWAPGGWYSQHRMDVIIHLPIHSFRVNDLRKVFELIFGAPPAHVDA